MHSIEMQTHINLKVKHQPEDHFKSQGMSQPPVHACKIYNK